MKNNETIVWSYGGGTQSIAIAVLIFQGKLPIPDWIIFADTGREASETMEYFYKNIEPEFQKRNMKLHIAEHSLAKVDLYAKNGDILIPAYTEKGKLPTFCSNEWKKRVVRRFLKKNNVNKCEMWIGFSVDEFERMKDSDVNWIKNEHPLIGLNYTRADCKRIVVEYGLPEPPKSSCWMCSHRRNSQWLRLKTHFPQDWQKAISLDIDMRTKDKNLFLHESRKPLGEVDLEKNNGQQELFTCNEFSCFT